MSKSQIWILILVLVLGVAGALCISYDRYKLSQNEAWFNCLNTSDPTETGGNMGCRGLYPEQSKVWYQALNESQR